MTLLLDTHCWLWFFLEPHKLGPKTKTALVDPSSEIRFSAASAWEIAIKTRLGKLRLPEDPERFVPSRMRDQRIMPLSVSQAHALRTFSLPMHHADPFDRLLIAQAQLESLTIVTVDKQFARYDIPTPLWADS